MTSDVLRPARPRRRAGPVSLSAALLTTLPALALAALAAGCRPDEGAAVAYVAVAGDNHVRVVDLAPGATVRRLYTGAAPWRLAVAPRGDRLWVQHWGAGTTAVVDLASHEVVRTLPLRGPGAFSTDGGRFLSFDWPGSALHEIDAVTFAPLAERVIEVGRVYDLAVAPDGASVYLAQFDPMASGPRQRYAYVVSYPLGVDPAGAAPLSLRTGRSPAALRVAGGGAFVLSADRDTNGLTLLNAHGDGRAVPTCAAPQAVLLSPDETRLVVPCWEGHGAPRSRLATYRVDVTTRPWPTVVHEREVEVPGGLVAGAFTPAGTLLLVDRTGGRLVEVDPATLEARRAIPVGDLPLAVAVARLPRRAVARLREEGEDGPARRRVRALLERAGAGTRPAADLAWTETTTWSEPPPATVERTRTLSAAFRPPDAYRSQTEDGTVRLATAGRSLSIAPDGRLWSAPRQELAPLVWALPALPPEEAVRLLAGDLPGGAFLAGGIAMDVVAEIETAGRKTVVVGALRPDEAASQLRFDPESGRLQSLVEQFPVFAARGHDEDGAPASRGRIETRVEELAEAGGFPFPIRLERVLDGRLTQRVTFTGVRAGAGLAAELFDPARLGGVAPPPVTPPRAAPARADGGPGRAVPIIPAGYLEGPGTPLASYASSPPTSGPRLYELADWGVHTTPIPPELQVHNLEHGGVALQYNCPGGCPELVERLAALAGERPWLLVAPWPWMEHRLALTAWGRIDEMDEMAEERIERFIAAWAGKDHHETGAAVPPAVAH